MTFPKRKPKPYIQERNRLLQHITTLNPASDEYQTVMSRLNDIDRILNRASETRKALIPAAGTAIAIAGVYALQQFGGILVPKALETLAARQDSKKTSKDD